MSAPEGYDFERCAECGMRTGPGVSFHPYLFCVLYKGGVSNPASLLAATGYVRPGTASRSDASESANADRCRL